MKITFVSNYINHHQIPLSNELFALLGEDYRFVQTQPMEEERVAMGWDSLTDALPYLLKYYEADQTCKSLILESDIVLFGGVDDEGYIVDRLKEKKPVIRISERLYKTGQWKAISPRGLKKKYEDHTQYRKAPVYLLCAGAYVPSDFHIVRAYPKKMYKWGYFPQDEAVDIQALMMQKKENEKVQLLWAGRFIDWKHPEKALVAAARLKQLSYSFKLTMVGGGERMPMIKEQIREQGLSDVVELTGFKKPEQVREYMKQADIFLFTSDYQEGWGAVLNEAMNSGCAVVANCAIGAAPYLIQPGKNGLLYQNGNDKQFLEQIERLVKEDWLRKQLGMAAYETIHKTWNAKNAAKALLKLCQKVLGEETKMQELPTEGPGSIAQVIAQGKMYRACLKQAERHGY